MNPLALIRQSLGFSQSEMALRLDMTTRALQYQEAREDPSPVWVLAAEMVKVLVNREIEE